MKKIYSAITHLALAASLVLGIFVAQAAPVRAQGEGSITPCTVGTTSGNLFGYLETDNIGPIYLSTESWNYYESAQTNIEFFVSYDIQTNTWDGRGWNAQVGWVDFGLLDSDNIGSHRAEFVAVKSDPASYGNWYPFIVGLQGVRYNPETGSFSGTAVNKDLTIDQGTPAIDDYVGAGVVRFDNVEYRTALNPCDENVNLFLNGLGTLYKPTCPISTPKITWTSNNVTNCQTDQGLWQNPGSRGAQNTLGENASGPITTANNPEIFRLKCTGTGSQTTVYGIAKASCGPVNPCAANPSSPSCQTWCTLNPSSPLCTNPDYCIEHPEDPLCVGPIDPTTGIIIPDFKEV